MIKKPKKRSRWKRRIVPLVLLAFLAAAAAYVKVEPVRQFVDGKCPWIKEQLAQRGIRLPEGEPAPAPTPAPPEEPEEEAATTEEPATPEVPAPTPAPEPEPPAPAPLDLQQLAANRELWPKTVKLKEATLFPAVMDGKEVGKITVPAGAEVRLIRVTPDKISVAYSPSGKPENTGGIRLDPEATDLLEQMNMTAKPAKTEQPPPPPERQPEPPDQREQQEEQNGDQDEERF